MDPGVYENFAAVWETKHPQAFANIVANTAANTRRNTGVVITDVSPSPLAGDEKKKLYDSFVEFVQQPEMSGFKPRTRFDRYLKQLSKGMEEEGMRTLATQTEAVTEAAKKDLLLQLKANPDLRPVIEHRVEEAILKRLQPESVRLARMLKYDAVVERAASLAKDEKLYFSLLKEGIVVNGAVASTQP